MPIPEDILRKWRDAASEERAIRSAAISVPKLLREEAHGLGVGPLLVRHVALLDAVKSPYLGHGNGDVTWHDLILAWLIVTDSDKTRGLLGWLRRKLALRRLRKNPGAAHELICAAIESAFIDAPPSKGPTHPTADSPVAAIVDCIASEYGWRLHDILNLPVKTAMQFIRCIIRRRNPSVPIGSASDRVVTEFLNELNNGN